jgi:hypothetical protein
MVGGGTILGHLYTEHPQIKVQAQLRCTTTPLEFFKLVLRQEHLAEQLCQAHGFHEALGNPRLL